MSVVAPGPGERFHSRRASRRSRRGSTSRVTLRPFSPATPRQRHRDCEGPALTASLPGFTGEAAKSPGYVRLRPHAVVVARVGWQTFGSTRAVDDPVPIVQDILGRCLRVLISACPRDEEVADGATARFDELAGHAAALVREESDDRRDLINHHLSPPDSTISRAASAAFAAGPPRPSGPVIGTPEANVVTRSTLRVYS